MDTGTVVWLPDGGGWDYDAACQGQFGSGYYACGEEYGFQGGILVYCCPY